MTETGNTPSCSFSCPKSRAVGSWLQHRLKFKDSLEFGKVNLAPFESTMKDLLPYSRKTDCGLNSLILHSGTYNARENIEIDLPFSLVKFHLIVPMPKTLACDEMP